MISTKIEGLVLLLSTILILTGTSTSFSTHVSAFTTPITTPITTTRTSTTRSDRHTTSPPYSFHVKSSSNDSESASMSTERSEEEKVVIIGGGWGGLSAAYALFKHNESTKNKSGMKQYSVTLVEASPRVGGLVRDGFTSMKGLYKAEAGQHGFWDNYHNIFQLLEELPNIDVDDVLTGYAEQGQYSPNGLEAVWPIYRDMKPSLPTGLAQALYTRFNNLSVIDRATAFPLVAAFSEFDDSIDAWEKYDNVSFRDLCIKLGVSKKCYNEAFEPMILTGLFAPGGECSAAAALGMAYFFVLKSQNSFDVRWCKGNIGEKIFQPWVDVMQKEDMTRSEEEKDEVGGGGVDFMTSTRVVGFETSNSDDQISKIICESQDNGETITLDADKIVFAVGGSALNAIVRQSPQLSKHKEYRRYANLRGTGVLATRLYLNKKIDTPYSANACWGFDEGIGMTFFDITKLHDITDKEFEGSIIEVDYYHAASLIVMNDEDIVEKAKKDIDTMIGKTSLEADVVDAAVVRLPSAVNWYSPGSYANMPDAQSNAIPNAYFVGDLVRSRHGSWSQEKAFVTGVEAANLILGNDADEGIIPLSPDETHVAFGRKAIAASKSFLGRGDPSRSPSLVDFFW